MKDSYIRQVLLTQRIQWTNERNELVQKALASEDYDEKDVFYRKAAVFGIRLDSIGEVIREIDKPGCSDTHRARSFQKHMREMTRLRYRDRPANSLNDALDQEVISQFYKDGVVVNNPKGFSSLVEKV